MSERSGVLAAVLSSALGGVAAAATRFVIGGTDPITLAAFRSGLGFLFLLPIALARRRRWPPRRDWSAVLALAYLWAFALERTTPTRVASTITVNPVTASVVAALPPGRANRAQPGRRHRCSLRGHLDRVDQSARVWSSAARP